MSVILSFLLIRFQVGLVYLISWLIDYWQFPLIAFHPFFFVKASWTALSLLASEATFSQTHTVKWGYILIWPHVRARSRLFYVKQFSGASWCRSCHLVPRWPSPQLSYCSRDTPPPSEADWKQRRESLGKRWVTTSLPLLCRCELVNEVTTNWAAG